jgi:uncharacterized Zn finger protein
MPWRDFYGNRPLREAKGGIKSQSRGFGTSWWAQRWIAVLESFDIGARLQRGRTYARKGQVLSIEVEKGVVNAKVQGSSTRPYKVSIGVEQLSSNDWAKLAKALSSQALFVAKLLAGEMPQDSEEAFDRAKMSLFPGKLKDMTTSCSCPDWSNPCKHIAAVYYLLGEEFDRDPFLIFKLRGIERDELLEQLRGPTEPEADAVAPEPLPTDPAGFWKAESMPEGFLGDVRVPPLSAALLKRLGGLPFWRGELPLSEAVEPVYTSASGAGLELISPDSGPT